MRVRNLQYLNKQFMLNIPVGLVEKMKWETGDKIDVVYKNDTTIELHKVGDKNTPKDTILIPQMQGEAYQRFMMVYGGGKSMDPIAYSQSVSMMLHSLAQMRKKERRLQR